MLTIDELKKSLLFLQQASASVQWVQLSFKLTGDTSSAIRLNDIAARIADEVAHVEKLIAEAEK